LHYGAWISVFDIRVVVAAVQPKFINPSKTAQQLQQLLVGENDQATAAALSIQYEEYSATGDPKKPAGNTKTSDFLAWMKKQARKGYSVSFGLFASGSSDTTYDHIVSYANIQSNYDDDLYHADDILCFNDWYGGPQSDYKTPYCYTFSDTTFMTTRKGCDASSLTWCLPDATDSSIGGNFGIAYKGSVDTQKYPVSLVPSLNVEGSKDAMTEGSNTRPALLSTTKQTLALTITGLTAGTKYNLYQFSSWNVAGTAPQGAVLHPLLTCHPRRTH